MGVRGSIQCLELPGTQDTLLRLPDQVLVSEYMTETPPPITHFCKPEPARNSLPDVPGTQ